MGAFAAYTFVAGIILLASYIIYKWLLSAENQPAFNRGVLLAIYVLSFSAYPLMGIMSSGHMSAPHGDIRLGEAGVVMLAGGNAQASTCISVLLWVYVAGMVLCAVWTAAVAVKLVRLIASGEKTNREGFTLVLVSEKGIAPFSWGRYIVMSRDEDRDSAEMILCHEMAHISCMHFVDLLLAQLVCIVLWYNPASWLMLSELKSVHEYQADSQVLSAGVNARQYQLLLIKKAVGVRFPSLANSLNHSKLKKRITMMYNRKTSAVRRSRALAIVPAVALALALVNVPSVSSAIGSAASARMSIGSVSTDNSGKVTQLNADRQASVKEDVEKLPQKLPQYPGGEMALFKYLMENVRYPAEAEKSGAEGRVVVGFVVGKDGSVSDVKIEKGVDEALDAEALRVVRSMNVKWIPGENDGEKVACSYSLPISFRLSGGKTKDKAQGESK